MTTFIQDVAKLESSLRSAVVFDEMGCTRQEFRFLSAALRHAWQEKVTGTVTTPGGELIIVRRGRRLSAKGKRWIPIA